MMMFDVGPLFAMGATPDGGSAWLQLVPFVLVLGIFYFIILLPMKRKQQKVQEFLDALKVGDRVITTGGIYGKITALTEKHVTLEIAPNVRIKVGRPFVSSAGAKESAEGEDKKDKNADKAEKKGKKDKDKDN